MIISPSELVVGDVIVAVHGSTLRSPYVVTEIKNRGGAGRTDECTWFVFHTEDSATPRTRHWYDGTKIEIRRRIPVTARYIAQRLGLVNSGLDFSTAISEDGHTVSIFAVDPTGPNGVRECLVHVKEV